MLKTSHCISGEKLQLWHIGCSSNSDIMVKLRLMEHQRLAHNNQGHFLGAWKLQQSLTSIPVKQSKNSNEGWCDGIASYKCIVLCKSHPLTKHVQGDPQMENFNLLALQQQRDCKKPTHLENTRINEGRYKGDFFLSKKQKKAYMNYHILQYSFLS